jgi:hypothetical protein
MAGGLATVRQQVVRIDRESKEKNGPGRRKKHQRKHRSEQSTPWPRS